MHGPIGSFATVHGTPVALAVATATDNHEAQSYVAFMRLGENVPTSPQSFIATMQSYTGSENWFYVDDRNIAVYQSGWFPEHAAGSNPDLPIWGTGQWDWKGFDPRTHDYDRLPASANPRSIDPAQGYLVNWNNAIAHGWRVAAGDWENGPVVRATMLQDDLGAALRSGPVDLAKLTDMVTGPSLTSDLRGMAVWPWLHDVLGNGGSNPQLQQLIALLNGWAQAGAQRRSTTAGGVVADSADRRDPAHWRSRRASVTANTVPNMTLSASWGTSGRARIAGNDLPITPTLTTPITNPAAAPHSAG